jgi:hypothetical protein
MAALRHDGHAIIWRRLKRLEARRDEIAARGARLKLHGHDAKPAEDLVEAFQGRLRLMETRLRSLPTR